MTDLIGKKAGSKLEGEGSRTASRRFQEAQRAFAETGDVEDAARKAARAIEGRDADELEKARRAAAHGRSIS